MRKSIYIIGKVSDLPLDEVKQKFASAAMYWRGMGYDVYSPMELVAAENTRRGKSGEEPLVEWEEIMRFLLPVCAQCEEVFALRDWKFSRGAIVEHEMMKGLGSVIHYENL